MKANHIHFKGMILLFTFLMILNGVSAISLGAGPATIEFENMVRGGYAERAVTVSTAGDDDLQVRLEVEGDIADWVSLDVGENFPLPGKSNRQIKLIVRPPITTPNGIYKGIVYVRAAPLAEVKSGVGISFGAGIGIKVTVHVTGEEVVGYTIERAWAKNVEIDMPLEVVVSILNSGNVEVTPVIHINIVPKVNTSNVLKFADYAETRILPTVTKDLVIKIPSKGLELGEYFAHVMTALGEEQMLPFELLQRGTLALKGKIVEVRLNKLWAKPDETIKVETVFNNDGELPIEGAKFKGEAYLIDPQYGTEQLVKTFESDPLNVGVGEEVTLSSYITPEKPGRYSVRGVVTYAGKQTPTKGSILNVLEEPVNYLPYIIVIGVAVVLAVYYLTRVGEDGRTRRFKRIWGDYLRIK